MKKFLKKHKRKIISIILISVSLIIILIPLSIKELPIFSCGTNKIEIIEKISQILASLFVIVGTVIAVWQYYLSSKSSIIKMQTDKVQKAIDLSEYYKNEVLTPFAVVNCVYKTAGIYEFLQKDKAQMKDFDVEEMNDIFSQDEIKKLNQMYSSKQFLKRIVEINEAFNLHMNGFAVNETKEGGSGKVVIKVDVDKAMNDFFNNYVTKVLNNAEQFAMYFTHNVADESVVYQSLYPTYIEMCRTLYYDISKCSELGKPKLYRNLQGLYEIWVKKSTTARQNIKAEETNNGTIPENFQ